MDQEMTASVLSACDKEESPDGSTVWIKIRQSTTRSDMESVTFAAAGVIWCGEEV